MTREQLEHIVRAAGAITDERTILVLGSQSILGTFPKPPAKLTLSREADVFPLKAPKKMELINGSIGEISSFDSLFGYYAHGLPPEACPLPKDWQKRLVILKNDNTHGVMGLCLDPADLAASKLAAGREKDTAFVAEMLRHKLISQETLQARMAALPKISDRTAAGRSLTIVQTMLGQVVRAPAPKMNPKPGPKIGL